MGKVHSSGRRYPTIPQILAADDRIWVGHARLLAEAIIRYHETATKRRIEDDDDPMVEGENDPGLAIRGTLENVQLIAEQLFPDWFEWEREKEEQRRRSRLEWKARQKKSIPRKLRKAVLERDAYRCRFCGDHRDLCIDHKIPEAKGGSTTIENLQTLCRPCNSRKCTRVEPHPLALPVSERAEVTRSGA